MTLYYSLVSYSYLLKPACQLLVFHMLTNLQVFLLLVAEMTLFVLLIVPLPFTWRLKVR
jgi:hypothetical protein